MKKVLLICVLCLYYLTGAAQVNLNFETGNFTGWTGRVGNTNTGGQMLAVGSPTIWTMGVNSSIWNQSYHTITTGAGTDQFGGAAFPVVAPGGSYSARLGGSGPNVNNGGACGGSPSDYTCPIHPGYVGPAIPPFSGAESLEQSFVVTSANCIVNLQYAAVFNNGNHSGAGATVNPFFRAEVLNSGGTSISNCLTYTFVLNKSALLPGSYQSASTPCYYPSTSASSVVVCMPWQRKIFDLSSQIGQTVTVKFTAGGCDEGGHFGYAYIDASAGPKALIQTGGAGCTGPVTLTGPTQYGSTYTWAGPGTMTTSANSATVNTSGTYSMTVGTGSCAIVFTTTVNLSGPTISATSSNQSVCSGGVIGGVAFTPSPAGATINWTNSNTNVGLVASGTGDIASYTSPTVTTQQVAVVTATPTFSGCTGPAKTFTITINPYPNLSVGSNPTITCSSTTAVLSSTSTTSGTTYSWSPGGSSPTSSTTTVSNAGTYTVSATVAGCVTTSVVTVNTNTSVVTASTSVSNSVSCSTTTAQIVATTTTSPASYVWSGTGITSGAGTATINVNQSGTFNYTITNTSNGCKTTGSQTVGTNTALPNPTATSPNSITCSTTTVALTGGPSSLTYTWTGPGFSGGTNSQNATANTSGNYTLTVTGANGCTNTAVTTVGTNTAPPNPTATSPNSITCSTTTVALTGGPSSLTYTWTGPGFSGGTNSQNATATSVGNYTLAVTGANGCTNTAVTAVGSNTTPPAATATLATAITCTTTSATLSGGPSSGVTYSWSGPGLSGATNAATATITSAGSYTLTTTSTVNGCTNTAVVTVTPNNTPPAIFINPDLNINCANLTATVSGSSSTPGATYAWTGPTAGNPAGSTPTNSASVVSAAGDYTLTVTDPSNGCTSSLQQSVVQNITPPNVTVSSSQTVTCTSPSAVLTGSSTTNPVNYSWTGPTTGTPAGSTPTNSTTSVNTGGTYTLTLTDPTNSCTNTAVVTIDENITPPTATSSATGVLNCTLTTIDASITTTTSPVSYTWSGTGITSATNTSSITANQPGTFDYTVTNTSNGCTTTGSQSITQDIVIPTATLTPSSLTTTCASPTATLLVTSSSDPNATYTWTVPASGSLNNTTINNPTASGSGVFTVAVTNTLNGCVSAIQTVTITADANSPVLNATSNNPVICSGSTTTLSVAGADSYTWSADAGSVTTSTAIVSPTTTTTYSVIGTNTLSGCSNVTNISIIVNATPTVGTSSNVNSICIGENAIINLTGANSYTVTNPMIVTTNSAVVTPTTLTTYTVIGESFNCMSATQTISIDVNSLPTLTTSATSTLLCSSGNSTLSITGADTYTWSTLEVTPSITVTPSNTTTYTVVGTNTLSGCTNTTNITVNVTPTPSINISATAPTICEGNSTTLTLTGATNYTVTNPSQTTTNTLVVSPTTQTTYTVIGETSNCLSTTQTITIDVNQLPQIAVANATTCAGTAVTLTANNADTYNWLPTGTTTNTLSVTPTGTTTYSVTGTNTLTGCTSTITTADVTVNALPTVTASANPNTTCTSGTVNLTASTSATSYTWTLGNGIDNTNQNQSNPSFPASSLTAGTYVYTVTVTSIDNCVSVPGTATLNIIDIPNADFDLSDLTICQNDNGSISINTPQSGVNYDWNINGQTIPTTNPLTIPTTVSGTAGTYTVSVIAGIGTCTNTTANTLTVNALPTVALVSPTATACETSSAQLDVAGPNGTYNYNWTNGSNTATGPNLNVNPLTQANAGNYTVTATDANGCVNKTIGNIVAEECITMVPEIFTPNGDGKNDGFFIRNIEFYPNNKLKIFNRWGNLIYQKDGYLNEFEGYANTGDQVGKNKLPSGTYYVVLEYGDEKTETYNGFLLLQY